MNAAATPPTAGRRGRLATLLSSLQDDGFEHGQDGGILLYVAPRAQRLRVDAQGVDER